jgi:hypothetical protein
LSNLRRPSFSGKSIEMDAEWRTIAAGGIHRVTVSL